MLHHFWSLPISLFAVRFILQEGFFFLISFCMVKFLAMSKTHLFQKSDLTACLGFFSGRLIIQLNMLSPFLTWDGYLGKMVF